MGKNNDEQRALNTQVKEHLIDMNAPMVVQNNSLLPAMPNSTYMTC